MTLKIVQLSDCHLPANPDQPYRGENADENLRRVWQTAGRWRPDVVLLTGDLSEDGSAASYARLKSVLDTRAPVLALPGNHDDSATMRRYFPHGPWDGPSSHEAGDWCLILLNSSRPGRIDGVFDQADAEALHGALEQTQKAHVLLALHHQPIPVEAPWIDRYPLREPDIFLSVVDSEPRVRCVVWGHIHHHFAAERDGVLMLGSPSTAANSLARAARFTPDPAGPACRRLALGSDGAVAYGQLYSAE